MISKELLQCLNKHLTIDEVVSNDKNRIDNNIYWLVKEIDILQSKNIYELEHQYKVWAFEKGFAFKIEYLGEKDINIQLINCRNEKVEYSKDFYNILNIEHIITPCQWILDNKETK